MRLNRRTTKSAGMWFAQYLNYAVHDIVGGRAKHPKICRKMFGKVQGSIKTRQRIDLAANYWAL